MFLIKDFRSSAGNVLVWFKVGENVCVRNNGSFVKIFARIYYEVGWAKCGFFRNLYIFRKIMYFIEISIQKENIL